MRRNDYKVSIVTVNYKSQRDLILCVGSIVSSKPKTSYEVIVVDNDEMKTLKNRLLNQFPLVHYLKSPRNVGFGAGNNMGAKIASGDFIFFLNPDTIIYPKTIDTLTTFLSHHPEVAIVAPLLHAEDGEVFDQQGSMELTPLTAIFALSFVNKYFPKNPISQKYFLRDWSKKTVRAVDVVPGSAFMIKKDVFEKINGFDERMFLFFEEEDLCKRVRNLGYTICINPEANVIHKWGKDKQDAIEMKKIFAQSRFYYFRKHFGLLSAIIVHALL